MSNVDPALRRLQDKHGLVLVPWDHWTSTLAPTGAVGLLEHVGSDGTPPMLSAPRPSDLVALAPLVESVLYNATRPEKAVALLLSNPGGYYARTVTATPKAVGRASTRRPAVY